MFARNNKKRRIKGQSRLSCALCQMKRKIGSDEDDMSKSHGYVCEWFCFRITPDELNDPFSELREHCIKHGNHFHWIMPGVNAHEYAATKREQMEWIERTKAVRYAMWSVIVAVVALFTAVPMVAVGG